MWSSSILYTYASKHTDSYPNEIRFALYGKRPPHTLVRHRRAVAKAGGGAADNNAMNGKILVLRNELATVLNKPMDEIPLIKCKNGLYDPIDSLMIISEKDRQNAAHDLRVICDKYPDMCQKLTHVAFAGQGNHSNSKGCDLPTLVEIMMLSPSRKGATIRHLAAVTLCRITLDSLWQIWPEPVVHCLRVHASDVAFDF
jgi:hypothetical protein